MFCLAVVAQKIRKDCTGCMFRVKLLDFVPNVGGVSLAEAPACEKAPGVAPANVAVGISSLGGCQHLLTRFTSPSYTVVFVGDDEFGYTSADMLINNVETSRLCFDCGVEDDGEMEFMFLEIQVLIYFFQNLNLIENY
ncbi:putative fructokinase-7 [Nymphaea thermarum]|nr:putative fructokinase-7 [Nymphaea thermarum]